MDTACTAEEKAAFKNLTAESVTDTVLAGDPISAVLVKAPGNHAAIGGLKVTTENGWFAARPITHQLTSAMGSETGTRSFSGHVQKRCQTGIELKRLKLNERFHRQLCIKPHKTEHFKNPLKR